MTAQDTRTEHLRAGPVTLLLEAGRLRSLRAGGVELLRGMYAAVRLPGWTTAAPRLELLEHRVGPDEFHVRLHADYRPSAPFTAELTLRGDRAGTVSLHFLGQARAPFWRNRVGLCALYPAAAAGQEFRIERGGEVVSARLPLEISPRQPLPPFTDLRALEHAAGPGWRARTSFEGERFEVEDQRNWTDASFKVFGTPLGLPYPVRVEAGEVTEQRITLSLLGRAPPPRPKQDRPVKVRPNGPVVELPPLGTALAPQAEPLTPAETGRLRALPLGHLRAELHLGGADWPRELARAAAEAQALNWPLDLALTVPDQAERQRAALRALAEHLRALRPPLRRFLVYAERARVTPPELLEGARAALEGVAPQVPCVGGTDTDFFFLNSAAAQGTLSPNAGWSEVAFALHPQAHAFDDRSLAETLTVQAQVAAQAARLAGGARVLVSPLTLLPRWNPYRAEAERGDAPADPRQHTAFAAVWTLGSLAALIGSGVLGSLTLYETLGARGLLASAGGASPLETLLRACSGARRAQPLEVDDPLRLSALALLGAAAPETAADGGLRVLLGNLSRETVEVDLSALPDLPDRSLLLGPAGKASCGPGPLLTLPPRALACLDRPFQS